MENNILQNKHDEIIFISDSTQSISIHKSQTDEAILESKESISCVFYFNYKQSEYSNALRSMLIRMLYIEISREQAGAKDLFYIDDGVGVFKVYMQSDSNAILTFANTLSESLPLGLDFRFKEIKPLSNNDFTQVIHKNAKCINAIDIKQDSMINIPNVLELHALLDKDNKEYRNIKSFVTLIACNLSSFTESIKSIKHSKPLDNAISHNTISHNIKLQDLIQNGLIESLATKLMQDSSITLQRNNTIFTLSLEPLDSVKLLESRESNNKNKPIPFLLFSTLDAAKSYLRMSEAQKSMLASFEKPFIKMQCKEVFAKELKSHTIFAGLSSDIIVLLLLSHLQDVYNRDYLFYTQDSKTQDSNLSLESKNMQLLHYTDTYPNVNNIESHSYIIADTIFINHDKTHNSLSSLLSYNKTESTRFITYLSTQHNSAFLIQNPQSEATFQQILNIAFATNLYTHLQVLHGYKNGDRLIYNFAKAYPMIVSKWDLKQNELESLGIYDIIAVDNTLKTTKSHQANNSQAIHKNTHHNSQSTHTPHKETKNLLDICLLIAQILDIDTSVLFEANRCVRDRGPRIDYKLKRMGNDIGLDYARLLRSVMSFKLAGVEDELLCYGVVDSLAEFIGTLASDMMLNYGIQEVFICGDLLLYQCFLDRIVKALPKNMRWTFPQYGGVDYLD